jgi:hypothetical protein
VPGKIADLKILDKGFSGPHPAPTGRHMEWDSLYAIVSPGSVSAGPNRTLMVRSKVTLRPTDRAAA